MQVAVAASFGVSCALAALQAYVHDERIWLHKTSEGDAEMSGKSILVSNGCYYTE